MKKILLTVVAAMQLAALHALPMGNPTEASMYTKGIWSNCTSNIDLCDPCFNLCNAWSFRIGFYGDYVYNRHLEVDGGTPHDAERAELRTNAAILAVNLLDRIDLFTTLGSTKLTVTENFSTIEFFPNVLRSSIFSNSFSWSLGGRVTLYECECFGLGLEGQYFRSQPTLEEIIILGNTIIHTTNGSSTYREWQLGLGLSYAFAVTCPNIALIPYLGATYARARLDGVHANGGTVGDIEFPSLKNQKPWSFVVGSSLVLCEMVGVTVEGRFAGEKALHVNGQFRF